MELCNDHYRISLNIKSQPNLDVFDVVHNPERVDTKNFYMARVLQVHGIGGSVLTVAVLDTICAGYESWAVLNGNQLIVILFSAIVRIDLVTGAMIQCEYCDNLGGLHEIYPIDNGYIIWGEGEIFRYSLNLNRVWSVSGRDILVSLHFNRHFWIDGEVIHVRDFEGWHYVYDLDGKLLCDFREAPGAI